MDEVGSGTLEKSSHKGVSPSGVGRSGSDGCAHNTRPVISRPGEGAEEAVIDYLSTFSMNARCPALKYHRRSSSSALIREDLILELY